MLCAAGEAFARHGFHGASMDSIAADAGISKPMLYNYFGSKERLYAAYLEQSGTAMLQAVRSAAPLGAPGPERLSRGILAFLAYVEAHRAGWSVLFAESVSQTGPVADGVAAVRERLAAMLATTLTTPHADLRDAHAHALVGAGESLANWWIKHPDTPPEHVAELLVRLADS
jgi:AcrR family transcriptional regulator